MRATAATYVAWRGTAGKAGGNSVKILKGGVLAAAIVFGSAGTAAGGIDESIAAAEEGNYVDALEQLVEPVRATLEEGVCDLLLAIMPGMERSIGSFEGLLADVHYFGHFVPKDYDTATKWYRRAADKDNALAQSTLGDSYYYGRGVPQNYAEAAKWWQLAADQGVGVAQLNLSVLFANGEGVTQDLVRSHIYANLAASQLPPGKDRDIAVKNRDYVANEMTPEQIAEAQRTAAEWQSAAAEEEAAPAEPTEDANALSDDGRCRW